MLNIIEHDDDNWVKVKVIGGKDNFNDKDNNNENIKNRQE